MVSADLVLMKKNALFLFKKNSCSLKIRMYDCIPPTEDFDCLRPDGSIIVSIDRRYNASMFKSRFDGWYESSVHL